MFQSRGVMVKSVTDLVWPGATQTYWPGSAGDWSAGFYSMSYAAMYRRHNWVSTCVNKIANATARLPLKVYQRDVQGRPEARDHPYAVLLRRPSEKIDPFSFWQWTVSTLEIEGEVFWAKIRDRGGRPISLVPLHPTRVLDEIEDDGTTGWYYNDRKGLRVEIPRRDLVHFKLFNPGYLNRGMSPLEPLRATLENEEGARRANSALWRNGGRPSIVLEHPSLLNDAALKRLSVQWKDIHSGVDNWAKAAILEEGMKANVIPLNVEELQYVEARKLNREEVCAAYDIPPPVVHILDKATFSNITEQMRSMYRDTMAPKLGLLESTLEFELRDGRMGEDVPVDFGDGVYAEFLMDEVLRGAFEARAAAYQAADWLTIAEKRELENKPFIPGTEHIFLNSASLPLGADGMLIQPAGGMTAVQRPVVRSLAIETTERIPLAAAAVRAVMGRLSRVKLLQDVDPEALVAGFDGEAVEVLKEFVSARLAGETVDGFKGRLRALSVGKDHR